MPLLNIVACLFLSSVLVVRIAAYDVTEVGDEFDSQIKLSTEVFTAVPAITNLSITNVKNVSPSLPTLHFCPTLFVTVSIQFPGNIVPDSFRAADKSQCAKHTVDSMINLIAHNNVTISAAPFPGFASEKDVYRCFLEKCRKGELLKDLS